MEIHANVEYSNDGRYYTIKNQSQKVKYDKHFPVDWALYDTFIEPKIQNLQRTNRYVGSVYCGNCRRYGSYNGVFVQYCKNCVFESKRPGCACILQNVMPKKIKKGEIYGFECNNRCCVFKTYLKDVDLCNIGISRKENKKKHKKIFLTI